MYPEASFHDYLDEQTRQEGQLDQDAAGTLHYQSERNDREFVRAALQRATPEDEIERTLSSRTEFVRLNPGRDALAYVRGLIEEEKGSANALSSADVAATVGAPSLPHGDQPSATRSRAEASEATARQYINENFQPSEWLAVVVRNRNTGETIQRMSTAERIAGADFQRWLRYKNAHGADVYLSLNTFRDHAQGRTKADLKEVRHLYLDLDQDGSKKLAAIRADDSAPQPNYVLKTSPDKYQVVWKVNGFGQDEAETLLRALAQRYGGDPAATDSTRVFRIPGFSNKKYEQDFQVTLTREAPPAVVYHPTDFIVRGMSQEPNRSPTQPADRSLDRPGNSQSEKDWAYAIRKLREGEDPEKIIRDMARYRSVDHYDKKEPTKVIAPRKANARYYAERTVTQAMAHLGITREPPPKSSGDAGGTHGEKGVEPSR